MKKKKVVFFCQHDWAGSAYQAVRAINFVGRIEARQVLCNKHSWGYDDDVVLRPEASSKTRVNDCDRYEEACQLLSEADYVHTWNNELADFYSSRREFAGTFPPYNEKYKSCTFTGTWYRRGYKQINERLKAANIKLVVQTPAFKMSSMESTFIPHAIDLDRIVPMPIEQRGKTFGCYHKSNTTADKDIILLKQVLKNYPGWEVAMEQNGVSNQEKLEQLSKCRFFMQDMDGRMLSYGRSTLEALAMGVPVVNRVHPEVKNYFKDVTPIIHATPETLAEVIAEVLTRDYAQMSIYSREWVAKYHSYQTIGEQYTKFFEELS